MNVFFNGNTAVKPGDPVLLYGGGLLNAISAKIRRLTDDDVAAPEYVASPTPVSIPSESELANSAAPVTADGGLDVKLLQKSERSLKFFIPTELEDGVYSVTLYGESEAVTVYLNAPSVKWAQGDGGSWATVGGWLRLSGERLSLHGETPRIWYSSDKGYKEFTNVKYIDGYSVEVALPEDIPAGEYKIALSNGFGGETACSVPVSVTVSNKEADGRPIINILDFCADPFGKKDSTDAFSAAFKEAERLGGAVVFVPRGRYEITDALTVPDNTTLRGESKQRSQIFFTPFNFGYRQLPKALFTGGTDITVEDLDFRGTRVMTLFRFGCEYRGAKNITLRRIRALFNALSGHNYHITSPRERLKIYDELLNDNNALVCVAGDNVKITDSEFASSGMTFGETDNKPKKYFLFKNNTVKERLNGWAYFVHSDYSIIEDNEFEGCTVGFGGSYAYLARNYIHDVLNNDREAFTTDMSYSVATLKAVKIEGTKITFAPEVKLRQDRVIGFGGLYISRGKGAGQARRVVSFTDSEVEIDTPFAVEPDTESHFSFGGTFRTAFYLINNRCYNTGHIQFYVDQTSSVYDGNVMECSAGLTACSRQTAHDGKDKAGTLPALIRMQIHFISMINNRLTDGNHFHSFGKEHEGFRDGWSGFSSIGCDTVGTEPTNIGLLIKNNTVSDNGYIRLFEETVPEYSAAYEDTVIDGNKVSNSAYGIVIDGRHAKRMLISRNDLSDNVDRPLNTDLELNRGDIEFFS